MTSRRRIAAAFAAIFGRKPPLAPIAAQRQRTKPGQIPAAIMHELVASGYGITATMIKDHHPDLIRASISAALRRMAKSGKIIRDGVFYRAREIERPALKAVEL